jgi:CTP:molybdopterin cytidylyltransferase MocA
MKATVAGVVLAAGRGQRMGRPKALLRHPDGTPLLASAVSALHDGGCAPVVVVLGAAADEARRLVDEGSAVVVVAQDWGEGMAASLRAGLTAVAGADAALVTLVDLPDVSAEVVRRVGSMARADPEGVLARATYRGEPGHPVLIGSAHWAGVIGRAVGDEGARGYLAGHDPILVECGDLATGRDLDTPSDLP